MGTTAAPLSRTAPARTGTDNAAILEGIQGVNKRMDGFESFMKSLEAPAQRAGLSPQDYVARLSQGGAQPVVFGEDGRHYPFRHDRNGVRLGKCLDPDTGKAHSFNDFCRHVDQVKTHGFRAEQSIKALNDMGMYVASEGKNGVVHKTALAESSGVTGGYAVPPAFSTELLRLTAEDGIVESRATRRPMTTRTLTEPSLDITTNYGAGQTPFGGGLSMSWVAEAQTRPESEPQFRQTTLTAWEGSFYCLASNTFLADQAVGMDGILTQLFQMVVGWSKDYAFINGNGVGKPLGVLNSPALIPVSKQTAAHFTVQDVAAMLAKLSRWNAKDGSTCWIVSQSCIGDIFKMNDQRGSQTGSGFGQFVFQPIDQGAQQGVPRPAGLASFGKLAGYDVMVSEKVPTLGTTGCAGLYDFSKYLVGQRMDIEIDMSQHVAFLKNQIAWRIIIRVDGQSWLNSAITLQNGDSVSPFICWQS